MSAGGKAGEVRTNPVDSLSTMMQGAGLKDGVVLKVLMTDDHLVRLAGEVCRGQDTCLSQAAKLLQVCKAWRTALSSDDFWNRVARARIPRAGASWVAGLEWGGLETWRERVKKLMCMEPVLCWVDDKPGNVEHLQTNITSNSQTKVYHTISTKEAIKWLTTHWEALHPRLQIITDNHRDELDESGQMKSRFDAGASLVHWLCAEVNGFRDAPVMIFCGSGSVQYVRELQEQYGNVEVNIHEGRLLSFALLPAREGGFMRHMGNSKFAW